MEHVVARRRGEHRGHGAAGLRGVEPERDVRLVLAGVAPPVRRLLDLTRTSELFEDAPDVAAALTRLSA